MCVSSQPVVALLRSEPDSVTLGYKHLAPLGRNPAASKIESPMTNGKSLFLTRSLLHSTWANTLENIVSTFRR